MRRPLFCAVILAIASPVLAADRRYAFEQITLDNGMRVISLEDFSCPIAAVQVWYHVGSVNEEPGRQGFAHMFEHMMFRGTDRLNETAHFDNVRRVGGNCNAYTSFDNTTYIQEIPSNQLEMVLWLESERMAFLKIDQKGFDTERRVVEEELRMGHNRPYGRVPEKLLAEIYGKEEYAWTPGGQIEHLRNSSIEDLAAFWNRYYVPNNATLVVVGAVKHADVQKLAKQYFGWIPTCPEVSNVAIEPSDQTKPRTIKIKEDKGPLPIIGIVYRTVPEEDADAMPLEMLMGIIGGGESSRLYLDVVKEQKIAQMAIAGAFGFERDGIAGAGGILLPFGNKKQLMSTIRNHIQKAIDEPVTAAELEKMKNQKRRDEVAGALTVGNKARLLGTYAVLEGDAERINKRLEEIERITAEDLQRVARKYLAPERRISVSVEPSATGFLGSLLSKEDEEAQKDQPAAKENKIADRTGPKAKAERPKDFPATPPSGALQDEIPTASHADKQLDNGLKVVVISNSEVPMASFSLGIRSGSWSEPKPGVAATAMEMLTKGTKTRTARQLAEALESNAISLSGMSDMDTAEVNGSALTDKLDLAAELMADVVQNPTFPRDEFDILQKQTKVGLMVSTKTPEYLADREFRRRLYGEHPYSRTVTGELEDLDNVTPELCRSWWADELRPDNCVLYWAGDITPERAFALSEKYFGSWKVETKHEAAKLPKIAKSSDTHIYLWDRPGSVQSQIRVGHVSITRRDPMYFTSRVLGNIFGGGFNSRLNKAIRVEKGLTYGARGGFTARQFAGELKISTFTKTPKTADTLRTILDEVDKIRGAPPETKEVEDTKSYLVGAFPGERETPEATVNDLWLLETQKLPADYFQKYLKAVKNTSAGEIVAAASALIDKSKLTVVVIGEARKIQKDLEKIAPVTILNPTTTMPAETAKAKPEETEG